MICMEINDRGESACKDARFDIDEGAFVCCHGCVTWMNRRLNCAEHLRREAEDKLDKYREAIEPAKKDISMLREALENIVDICKGSDGVEPVEVLSVAKVALEGGAK